MEAPDKRSDTSTQKFWTAPNIITVFRMGAVAVIMILLILIHHYTGKKTDYTLSYITAFIYFIVAVSDTVDGVIARRYNLVTDLGKLLDPIADKALVTTTAIMLIPLDRAPAWVIALIVLREVIITGIRGIATTQGVVIAASSLGKTKTVTQNVAFVMLIMHHPLWGIPVHLIGLICLYVALLLTWISGTDYIIKYARIRREVLRRVFSDG